MSLSQILFALGALIGVLIISMPVYWATRSNFGLNLRSLSLIKYFGRCPIGNFNTQFK
jgi:hypothetical protein